jgi:hypothetical protein
MTRRPFCYSLGQRFVLYMEVVLDFSDNKYGRNVIKMVRLLKPKRKYLNYV